MKQPLKDMLKKIGGNYLLNETDDLSDNQKTKEISHNFAKKIGGNYLLNETDGHPNLVKKNKEISHNWATHMEWKFSAHKEKYGSMIGEVVHHKLMEDGTIPSYDVKFGNKTIKNIPASKLNVVKEQGHSHEADEGDNETEDD